MMATHRLPSSDAKALAEIAKMLLMAGSDLSRVINVETQPPDADARLRRIYDLLGRAHALATKAKERAADRDDD